MSMTSGGTGLLRAVTCPICYKMYAEPIALDCGHTFCHGCLEKLQESGRAVFVFCPVCRKLNYDSAFKRKNYAVAQIVDVIRKSQQKSYAPPPILEAVTKTSSQINHRYSKVGDADQEKTTLLGDSIYQDAPPHAQQELHEQDDSDLDAEHIDSSEFFMSCADPLPAVTGSRRQRDLGIKEVTAYWCLYALMFVAKELYY